MLLVQFSISALNEYADAELDARAGRMRPIVVDLLNRKAAVLLAVVFGLVAIGLSGVAFGVVPTLLTVAGLACGWGYDIWLKPTPLSFLPFATAFPLLPIWVGVLAHRPATSFIPVILGGVPLAVGIHLADAIPDRDNDRHAGLNNLAVGLGRPLGEVAAATLVAIGGAVALSLWFLRFGHGISAVSMIALAAIYLLITLDARATKERWRAVLGKWVLIGDAIAVGVFLVALA